VVVINRSTALASPPPDRELLEALARRYPRATEIGHFLVLWQAPR
jgi:hypothetical protein